MSNNDGVDISSNIDNIVEIQIIDDIAIRWDNNTHLIIEDNLWSTIDSVYSNDKSLIINEILNVKLTPAKSCSIERNLYVGDIVFIIINKIENLPLINIINTQCDFFESGCPYPIGMFDAINIDRNEVKNNILQEVLK
jgi:hypothetical protein